MRQFTLHAAKDGLQNPSDRGPRPIVVARAQRSCCGDQTSNGSRATPLSAAQVWVDVQNRRIRGVSLSHLLCNGGNLLSWRPFATMKDYFCCADLSRIVFGVPPKLLTFDLLKGPDRP